MKKTIFMNSSKPEFGYCGYCGKRVHRIFKKEKPTWIITKRGIYHKICYIQKRDDKKQKQNRCIICDSVITHKQNNARYCVDCGIKVRCNRSNEKRKEWLHRNKKRIGEYAIKSKLKKKEIIRLLQIKYNVKTYDRIIEELEKELRLCHDT